MREEEKENGRKKKRPEKTEKTSKYFPSSYLGIEYIHAKKKPH